VDFNKFNRILRQASLLPVIALLLAAGAIYLQMREANRTVALIQQSNDRIDEANIIAKLTVDEEAGLRGYQTTGDKTFLQPYLEAEPQLQNEFDDMEAMPGMDSIQMAHMRRLREVQQTWRDGFARPVIATIEGGGQTNDVQLNLQGKNLMDKIRDENDGIVHTEEQREEERIALWHSQVRRMIWVLVGMALFLGLFIAWFQRSRLHVVSDAYKTSLGEANQQAQELFLSEQELRTTLASIGDGVITCDIRGRVEMMNPVASELTGWTQDEAKGRPLEDVFRIVDEKTRASVENPVDKVKRLNGVVGVANSTVLIRKDGIELHIADKGSPIRDHAEKMSGVVLVFRDVTIERKTQEALLANEKLAVAGRLAATIAHEIHNPLDAVSNLLYLMKGGVTPEESTQFMAMAEQELARVTQISRAMLGLYRESKAPVPVHLKEMLQEILLLMDRRFIDHKVTVLTELNPAVTVLGFPAELRQVFTNLLTNAAEAAGDGGVIRVSIFSREASVVNGERLEAGALVEIADNGPGIPEDIRPHLFQPFFTTKGQNGTGLGLWVSHGIITKHGGSIHLKSSTEENSHGTAVSVFLAEKPTIRLGGD
jgi:PAS domain S-box-containing protein